MPLQCRARLLITMSPGTMPPGQLFRQVFTHDLGRKLCQRGNALHASQVLRFSGNTLDGRCNLAAPEILRRGDRPKRSLDGGIDDARRLETKMAARNGRAHRIDDLEALREIART